MIDYGFWYVIAASAIEVYGDFSLRFYAQTNNVYWLAHGIAGYVGVIAMIVEAFRTKNVLYVNGIWDGASGLIESVAAYVLLGDRFQKTSEYIGLCLVIIGVALMKNGWF
jgi:multidrug transporter EmrE-like cation transporter